MGFNNTPEDPYESSSFDISENHDAGYCESYLDSRNDIYISEISGLSREDTFQPVFDLYQDSLAELERNNDYEYELPPYTVAFFQFLEITSEFNRKSLNSNDTVKLLDELNRYLLKKIDTFDAIPGLSSEEQKTIQLVISGLEGLCAAINLAKYSIIEENMSSVSNDVIYVARDADSVISQVAKNITNI